LDKAQPKQQMVTNHNKIEDADKKKKKRKNQNSGPCTYRKNHPQQQSTNKNHVQPKTEANNTNIKTNPC
jgi:hypothetical protein